MGPIADTLRLGCPRCQPLPAARAAADVAANLAMLRDAWAPVLRDQRLHLIGRPHHAVERAGAP